MPERDKNKPETVEQFGQGLLEFVQKTEFQTPEYEAVSDFLDLRRLQESLKIDHRNALSSMDDPEKNRHWESQTRITEFKIAFLEHQISHNQSRVKGYQSAYVHFGIGFDELMSIAGGEAEENFPGDEDQQRFYEAKILNSFFSKIEDAINTIRESS